MPKHDAKRVEAAMERHAPERRLLPRAIADVEVLADEVTRLTPKHDDWDACNDALRETQSEIETLWHKVADRDGECGLDCWTMDITDAFEALKSRVDYLSGIIARNCDADVIARSGVPKPPDPGGES